MIRQHHLTDLDDLLLSVRNKNSATYIQEAIIAYRTGAYRAAITSTWIAVCYDIVSKLRELAVQNDGNAIQFIEEFDTQIQNKNIPRLQDLENSLLKRAMDDFEFISIDEHKDLERLKEDRNLCAHPTYTGNQLLFQPTPELVRSHIVHSILHLLQRQPVQGKSAIDKVCADLESRAFPQTQAEVFDFLNDRYLQRAKVAFIKNLEVVLLKKLFSEDVPHSQRIIFSIQAIARAHPEVYLDVIQQKIGAIFEQLNDHNIGAIFLLLRADPGVWDKLQPAQRIKVNSFIGSLQNDDLTVIRKYNPYLCIDIQGLQENLLALFERLSIDAQTEIIEKSPNKYLSDKALEIFSNSNSYRNAEYYARTTLLPIAAFLSSEQVIKAIIATKENDQITYAGGIPEYIAEFFELTKHHLSETRQSWIEFIQSRLDRGNPDDHYAYPRLQALMQGYGLTWDVQQDKTN